jgi:hypothetical protein
MRRRLTVDPFSVPRRARPLTTAFSVMGLPRVEAGFQRGSATHVSLSLLHGPRRVRCQEI